MGVSFLSLLGDGFTDSWIAFGCSFIAFVSGTLSLGRGGCCCIGPPRFSSSSSSCTCCSVLARCICKRRSCTRSSMMASRSS
uniref:Uncharacterized protein n=1 Tax=Pseudonaja textilis TaxID=8673 RepID=A0A670ZNS6_PSETE